MSSADDVLEMKSIAGELADRLVGKVKRAARVGAVAGAVGVGENRALEFLTGRARKIEAWEKENGKRQRDALRERERIAKRTITSPGSNAKSPGTEPWARTFAARMSMACSICFAALAVKLAPWRYRSPSSSTSPTRPRPIPHPADD